MRCDELAAASVGEFRATLSIYMENQSKGTIYEFVYIKTNAPKASPKSSLVHAPRDRKTELSRLRY